MDNVTLVAILAGAVALFVNFSEQEKSVLSFLLWYGISFVVIMLIFALVKFVAE